MQPNSVMLPVLPTLKNTFKSLKKYEKIMRCATPWNVVSQKKINSKVVNVKEKKRQIRAANSAQIVHIAINNRFVFFSLRLHRILS